MRIVGDVGDTGCVGDGGDDGDDNSSNRLTVPNPAVQIPFTYWLSEDLAVGYGQGLGRSIPLVKMGRLEGRV